MVEALKISKKEQERRESLIDGTWDELIEKKPNEWDIHYSLEDFETGSSLEKLIISAVQRLDLSFHRELDDLRKTVFGMKKELETLIRDHKHADDGSACKPI